MLVEDDANLLAALAYNLGREGYEVTTAADGEQAIEMARRQKPDLIILDLMLPRMSGLEVCRILRGEMTVPILMLTAKAEEADKVIGLELGADDYMTKPFSVRELQARVHAILRRSEMQEAVPVEGEPALKIDEIEIDPARHLATRRGDPLGLTPKEFDLLAFLAKNKGFVFSREQLLEKVWGYDYPGDTRTIDVHIRWLRRKIEPDPQRPRHLITIRGIGYKLEG
jgi:two-component system OmpR family response regulator